MGCQPVLFGSLPKSPSNALAPARKLSSASCRRLQAGSLRSPELKLNFTAISP